MNNIHSELFTQSSFVAQCTDWHWVTRCVWLAALCVCMCGCTSVNPRPTFGSIMGSRLRRVDILFEEKYKAPLRQCVPPAPPSAQNRDLHSEKGTEESQQFMEMVMSSVKSRNELERLKLRDPGSLGTRRIKVFSYSGNSAPMDWEQRVTWVFFCYVCLEWFYKFTDTTTNLKENSAHNLLLFLFAVLFSSEPEKNIYFH